MSTTPELRGGLDIITTARRAAVALGIAGLVAGVLHATGHDTQSSEQGGWRELSPDEIDPPQIPTVE
jgi:hypothetical protein